MSENQINEEVKQDAPAAQEEGNSLSVNDLNALKSIIDVASQRGAFKPSEMVVVGQTYNKLAAFLDNVARQAAANQQGE